MEAICSSETPVDTQRNTWRYIPEESTLHNQRCENLKSYKMWNHNLSVSNLFYYIGLLINTTKTSTYFGHKGPSSGGIADNRGNFASCICE
jgi:hypothetical protein